MLVLPIITVIASQALVVSGFGLAPRESRQSLTILQAESNHQQPPTQTRSHFLLSTATSCLGTLLLTPTPSSAAAERTIAECPSSQSSKGTCISTASIKQIDNYSPPWTFQCSPDEAFARLKGAIAADPIITVTELDAAARYVRVEVQRNLYTKDEIEFLIKAEPSDDGGFVTYRSAPMGDQALSDFGVIRRRLETLRSKGGVFGVMGQGLGSADYYSRMPGKSGNGPFDQLKAFYGLQSGQGFEDVFD